MSYHFKSFPHHSYTKEKLAKLGLPAADIKYMTAHGLPVLKDYCLITWYFSMRAA